MKNYIKPILLSSVIGFAVSLSACSQASSADTPQAVSVDAKAAIDAGNWDIQADRSHIQFSAEQEGKTFTGGFESFSGVINFDPAAPENGSVTISIPLKSVDAGSNDRNSTLPEKVWFSTKTFPAAVFSSSDISVQDAGYLAKGELTLKGISVPFDLPFALDIKNNTAVMTSNVDMDRTLWNVGAAPWNTDEWVSRTVKLDIKVTAEKLK